MQSLMVHHRSWHVHCFLKIKRPLAIQSEATFRDESWVSTPASWATQWPFGPRPCLSWQCMDQVGSGKSDNPDIYIYGHKWAHDVEPILDHFGGWYVSTYRIIQNIRKKGSKMIVLIHVEATWPNLILTRPWSFSWCERGGFQQGGGLATKIFGPTRIVGFDKKKLSNRKKIDHVSKSNTLDGPGIY